MDDIRLCQPLRLFAPAKLNLGLEITGRRSDGFHEIVTILQTVSIFDVIDLRPAPTFEYIPDPLIPGDDLALRALRLAGTDLGVNLQASVRLTKRIPVAAGLGGGSSDAGMLLGVVARLAGRAPRMAERTAARLGSDVPFFVRGGTALATGTGTSLQALRNLRRTWFVVATPGIVIPEKTRALYQSLSESDFSDGQKTMRQASRIARDQPIDPGLLVNTFERALMAYLPIARLRTAMLEAGADLVLPSGAGPSLYAPFPMWADAHAVASNLRADDARVFVCTNVGPDVNSSRITRFLRFASGT